MKHLSAENGFHAKNLEALNVSSTEKVLNTKNNEVRNVQLSMTSMTYLPDLFSYQTRLFLFPKLTKNCRFLLHNRARLFKTNDVVS